MKMWEDLQEFHKALDIPITKKPGWPPLGRQLLRAKLIVEEVVNELLQSMGARLNFWKEENRLEVITVLNDDKKDLVGMADGIIDSLVVILGAAAEYGIPVPDLWNEIHRTNMAKQGGPVRSDGKVLKPDGWEAPDVEQVLKDHGWGGW